MASQSTAPLCLLPTAILTTTAVPLEWIAQTNACKRTIHASCSHAARRARTPAGPAQTLDSRFTRRRSIRSHRTCARTHAAACAHSACLAGLRVHEASHPRFVRIAPACRDDCLGQQPTQCLLPTPAEHMPRCVIPFGDVAIPVNCNIWHPAHC